MQQHAGRNRRAATAQHGDDGDAAVDRETAQVARQVVAGHHVEHHVDAAAIGQLAHDGSKILAAVVDHVVGARRDVDLPVDDDREADARLDAGSLGDGGPATLAEINSPRGITVDKTGNVYFTDVTNNRIRKIDTAGIITTVGGNGIYGYNGENIPATDAAMRSPDGLTIDSIGNLYFAENDNDRVRKIGVNGLINTVIGNGLQGYSGDGGDPLSAELYWPASVALDLHNNIFVTDAANNRIRMVRYNVSVGDIEKPESNVIISPNPSTGIFSVSVSTPATETFEISVTDLIGREVLRTHATSNKPIKILLQQHEGVYYLQAANEHRILKEKIVVIK